MPTGPPLLDVYRAVVCLQIVSTHAYFSASFLAPWRSEAANWVVGNLRFGYESFFVLAGYFLAHSFRPGRWSHLSVRAFVGRRLIRLAVPFWVAVALGGVQLRAALTGDPYRWPDARSTLALLLFVPELYPGRLPAASFWFMAPLVQFYVLWTLLFWLVRGWYLRHDRERFHDRTLRMMVALSAAIFAVSIGIRVSGLYPLRWHLPREAAFIAIGCVAYWRTCGLAVGGAFQVATATLIFAGLWGGDSRLVAGGVSALAIPMLRGLKGPDWLPARILAAVAACSYSIYLTHLYIVLRVIQVPQFWGGVTSFAEGVAVFGAAIVAAVLGGALFFVTVERPVATLARRISYRGTAPTSDGDAL